jgi:hypothetical protein
MDWKEAIERWRKLPLEEQRKARLRQIPQSVARSMAFEGEPVDQEMLQQTLEQQLTRRDS